ncbi:MAG TPA: hypothetical protein VL400_20685, partial [Polyangiaceae bacterium]|nr:hypothetical protein [Polyangiaceae bacterium]
LVDALRTSLRHGFSMELSPECFGVRQGEICYLGELGSAAPVPAESMSSMLVAVQAVERSGADVGTFLDAVERRLASDGRLRTPAGASEPPAGATGGAAGDRLYALLARAALPS